METIPENERLVTPEELEQLEVDHELAHRIMGGRALEMYSLPLDRNSL